MCAELSNAHVTATGGGSAVALAWSGTTGASITVSRKSYCGSDDYTSLATLPVGATSYVDTTVQAGWVYWYRVTLDDGAGDVGAIALGAQAADAQTIGCTGGAAPQDSGVDDGACGSGSAPPDAGPGPTPSPSSVPLDCAHSTQADLCKFVSTTMKLASAASPLSTACQASTNVVNVDPSNFATIVPTVTAGHTIVFAAGTYHVPSPITLVDGVNYCGNEANPSTVVLDQSNGFFFNNGSSGSTGMTIAGFTMDGGGVYLGINGKFSNVFIQHNVIQNCQTSGGDLNYGAAVSGANVGNLTIASNYIYNTLSGIRLWQFSGNVNVTDNEVSDTLWDDLAAQGSQYAAMGAHLRIARNGFVETHRITMEMYIPAALSVLIEDNAVVHQQKWAYFTNEGTFPMAISMPYAPAGVMIRNNWLVGSPGVVGTTAGAYTDTDHGVTGIETYGAMTISHNVIQYFTGAFLEAAGGAQMSISDNSLCDDIDTQDKDGGWSAYAGTYTNNGCVRAATGNYAVPQP